MLEINLVHVNNNYDNVLNMGHIPKYPEFKLVDKSDKPVFQTYTMGFASYSDFNLLSLLSWNTSKTSAYSILNNNLVIKLKDYLGDNFIYSVLGNSHIQETLTTLLRDFNMLSMVPEVVIKNVTDNSFFSWEEDRDNFDYIMKCEKIGELNGSEYKHLRHDINHFNSLYGAALVKSINLDDSVVLSKINRLDTKWYTNKKYEADKINEQEQVFSNFLNNCRYFDMLNLGFFLGDELIGYILSEKFSENEVISHFGCSDSDYAYCDYALKYYVARKLYELGFLYQNQEQDAGLPGLRTAKIFYNPEFFLKKYKITLK